MTELELTGKGRDLLGRRQPRKEFENVTELELTGNGRDLLGRRQPRKEFASEDFPVPEAPNTTI